MINIKKNLKNTTTTITTIKGEMYMYNRNSTGQSMSEFIKEKITEDDEETKESLPDTTSDSSASTSTAAAAALSRNNDDSLINEIKSLGVSSNQPSTASTSTTTAPVKFRIDDDFLFQMDKGSLNCSYFQI